MRNLSGFANLRSILVLWIFSRTGMPFFFFKFKSVRAFLVFLVEQGRPLLVLLPFTVTNLSGFRGWFHCNTLQIDVMFKTWSVTSRELHAPFDCSFAEADIIAIWSVCALLRTGKTIISLLTNSWPYLNFSKPPFLGVESWVLSARSNSSCWVYQ